MPFHKQVSAWLDCLHQSLRQAAWAPLLVVGIHFVAMRLHVYHRYPAFDIPMHFFGGLAMAFFLHRTAIQASSAAVIGPYHPVTHRLLVFIMTCTVAVFWEFSEFIADHITGSFSQLGLDDTLGDLLFGTLGAGFFIILVVLLERHTSISAGRLSPKSPALTTAAPEDLPRG